MLIPLSGFKTPQGDFPSLLDGAKVITLAQVLPALAALSHKQLFSSPPDPTSSRYPLTQVPPTHPSRCYLLS